MKIHIEVSQTQSQPQMLSIRDQSHQYYIYNWFIYIKKENFSNIKTPSSDSPKSTKINNVFFFFYRFPCTHEMKNNNMNYHQLAILNVSMIYNKQNEYKIADAPAGKIIIGLQLNFIILKINSPIFFKLEPLYKYLWYLEFYFIFRFCIIFCGLC